MRLQGKAAIVTGASRGIGEAIALRYAKEGAKVAIVDKSGDADARAVAQKIRNIGGVAVTIKADCSKVADVERMVATAIRELGRVDILVNNAGVFRPMSAEETTEAIWDEQLDLNLKGPFFATRALLPEFKKNGGGKVINITSIAGVGAFPNCSAYCASKGGLVNLTRALATELGKYNINVNSLAPGNVATSMNAAFRGPGNEEYLRRMRMMTPTERDFLDAEEMTGTAVFLASDDSAAVHGVTVLVDAGWAAW